MEKYNVAIIGAGQLGSRHLQGLKRAASPLSITVLDSSQDSLKIAKERYEAVLAIGEKYINFTQDINQLPSEVDLVIVATGSKPRAAIVRSLLNVCKVKNLVLEKVLFPRLLDYEEIATLINEKEVNTWVNCPRRMFGNYQQILQLIDRSKPIMMKKGGENWGLCCNGIHIIDIFMYLTGEEDFTVDTSKLNKEIEESKRPGYIEMTGELTIITSNGNKLTLVSENIYSGDNRICIVNGGKKIIIEEDNGVWENGDTVHSYKVPFQSQLSGLLADGLLVAGCCSLTPFGLSVKYHKPFINALLDFYNKEKGENTDLLPIT